MLRYSGRAVAGAIAVCLSLATALPAEAQVTPFARVEEWDASWSAFTDDFGDGVFADTSPFQYLPCPACTETGGALQLDTGTSAFVFVTSFAVPGEPIVRATYRIPSNLSSAALANFGVSIGDPGVDFVNLQITRVGSPFNVFLVEAFTDPPFSAAIAMQTLSASAVSSAAAIEFVLTTSLNTTTNELLPTAMYRLCSSTPCESEQVTPLTLLGVLSSASMDAERLRVAQLFAFDGDGNVVPELEEWSIETAFADDFEDPSFAAEGAYRLAFDVGSVSQANGLLEIKPDAGGALFLSVGPDGLAPPGPTSQSAVFLWDPPPTCGSFGIGQSVIGSIGVPGGFANLQLVRAPNLDNAQASTDALYVWLTSEAELPFGSVLPIVQRATISTDPDNDSNLTDVTGIELGLETVPGGQAGVIEPRGEYRLCRAGACSGAFTALVDHTAAVDPTRSICPPLTAADYDPSLDDGALPGAEGLNVSLIAVPEPTSQVIGTAALAMLACLRRARSSLRVQRNTWRRG